MVIIRTTKELKPRSKHDFYPTPLGLCRAALRLLPPEEYQWILDPGSGTGVWGIAARELFPQSYIVGVEKFPCNYCAHKQGTYDEYHYEDFLTWTPSVAFSTIIGNIPYSHAKEFIDKSLDILGHGGRILFLLRLAFLESRKRYKWWKEVPLKKVWVLANRPSFTNDGHTDETAYALYLFEKGYDAMPVLDWLSWEE